MTAYRKHKKGRGKGKTYRIKSEDSRWAGGKSPLEGRGTSPLHGNEKRKIVKKEKGFFVGDEGLDKGDRSVLRKEKGFFDSL